MVISPFFTGAVADFNKASLSVMPLKLFEASVLYPQVSIAKAAGVTFKEAGSSDPRLFMLVSDRARMYNL